MKKDSFSFFTFPFLNPVQVFSSAIPHSCCCCCCFWNSWNQLSVSFVLRLLPLTSYLPKNIQVRRTRYTRHFWKSKDELINDILLWTPMQWRLTVGRPATTYLHQVCEDTGCSLEEQLGIIDDRDRERKRKIRVISATWWQWRWFITWNHISVNFWNKKLKLSKCSYNKKSYNVKFKIYWILFNF